MDGLRKSELYSLFVSTNEELERKDHCPLCGSASAPLERPDALRDLGIPGVAAALAFLIVLGIVISLWQRSVIPVVVSLLTSGLMRLSYRLGHYKAELVHWKQANQNHVLTRFEEFIVSKF